MTKLIMPRTAVAVGALGALNLSVINAVPIYFMNVPLSTMVMAFLGSLLFHAWSDEVRVMTKKNMYISMLFFAMISTALVAVLPNMLGWEWYSTKLEGSLAFIFAASSPSLAPVVRTLLPEIVRKWFRLGDAPPKITKEEKGNEDL